MKNIYKTLSLFTYEEGGARRHSINSLSGLNIKTPPEVIWTLGCCCALQPCARRYTNYKARSTDEKTLDLPEAALLLYPQEDTNHWDAKVNDIFQLPDTCMPKT